MEYRKRYVDEIIASQLKFMGAVFVQGPKACGKTTTCRQFAKTFINMADPYHSDDYIMLAATQPALLLEGEKPVLIDEWQVEKRIWNAVRTYVDNQGGAGLVMLTGSTTPVFDRTMHSGTARISRISMYPLSLFESGDSNGAISLASLKEQAVLNSIICSPQQSLADIAYLICRGGWPQMFAIEKEQHLRLPKSYLESVLEVDIKDYISIKRNHSLARLVLKAYARASATTTLISTIIADVRSRFPDKSEKTIRRIIDAFEKMYIIRETPGWNPYAKSRTAIRTSPKKDFIDPSLAAAVMNLTPELLLSDMLFFGNLFESMVRRDLNVYVSALGGSLCHYRDRHGLECDSVLLFEDDYALVEVKLGRNEIDKALKNIRRLIKAMERQNRRPPLFSMIITAFGIVTRSEDGIWLVPIGCLRA